MATAVAAASRYGGVRLSASRHGRAPRSRYRRRHHDSICRDIVIRIIIASSSSANGIVVRYHPGLTTGDVRAQRRRLGYPLEGERARVGRALDAPFLVEVRFAVAGEEVSTELAVLLASSFSF